MTELIEKLTSNLNINQDQAQGALGSILKLAKAQLGSGDFSKISEVIGDSSKLMDNAPEAQGFGSMLGGITSALGVDTGSLGGLATLAGQFKSLNLDSDMITKMTPIILSFLETKGGKDLKDIASKLFSN